MAKLKISRVEIAAAVSDSEKIVRLLQRRGCIELSEPEELEYLNKTDESEVLDEIDRKIQAAENAAIILKKYSDKKSGLLDSLNERTSLSEEEFNSKTADNEEAYNASVKAIELDKQLADNKISAVRLETLIAGLRPWEKLDIPLNTIGTKKTAVIIGSIPKQTDRESILSEIARDYPEIESVDAEVVYSGPDQTCVVVFCVKKDLTSVEQSLRESGFSRLSDAPDITATQRIEELNAQIAGLDESSQNAQNELAKLAVYCDKIDFLKDYYSIEKDEKTAMQKVVRSEKICVFSGYVPEIRCEKLKSDIEQKYNAAVVVSEPGEDEDVPVVLKNNGFAEPVETITEMYSMPGKNDIDPTAIMSFFYYFFFGMMLSDAGYGLIIALVTGILLLKKKMEKKMKNTLKMYFFCGVSTVFWGAMYGSWFGDIPNVIGSNFFETDKFASTAIWMDPLSELMRLLVYCFIFGLVHLFVGVGLKAYTLWRQGKKLDAICESIPTYVMVLGLCPIFFGLFTEVPEAINKIGTPLLIVGAVLVIATAGRSSKNIFGKLGGGLYGLYNLLSGYLGDVLSYARLLALGLSTGVIAQVVNMLCTLPSNKVLQIIMLVVVGSVGHIANLGINLIGAYVHTNRLQYVEFFSKFYEGGGRAMHPLTINTKKYKFKEEN